MLNIPLALKSFTLTASLFFVSLSRMRNLLVTPPRVPLPLSLTTTQKMVGSSAGVPTPSAIHLWRNASPSRGSQAARAKLYYTDNSLLTQNCYRAGNLYFTAFPAFTWKQEAVQNMYISSVMLLKCIFLFHNNDCFVFVANAKCFSFSWYNTKIFSQPLIYSLNIFHVQHRISHLLFHYPWTIASRFLSLFWSFRVVLCSDQKLILLCNVYYFSFFFFKLWSFYGWLAQSRGCILENAQCFRERVLLQPRLLFLRSHFPEKHLSGFIGLPELPGRQWDSQEVRGAVQRTPPQLRPLCINQRQREWVAVLTWGAVQTF